jgi:hypothetical protein
MKFHLFKAVKIASNGRHQLQPAKLLAETEAPDYHTAAAYFRQRCGARFNVNHPRYKWTMKPAAPVCAGCGA